MNWRRSLIPLLALSLAGCSLDQMAEHSKLRPFAPSPAFSDHSSARPPVPGTVARGQLDADDFLYRGEENGRVVDRFPFAITRADLQRGRERFEINCSPCHGRTGLGYGMVAARGFSPPPSYLAPRLLQAKVGHLYQVISNGYGAMASYGDQVSVEDRWRIVAYIRALQLSRRVKVAELPSVLAGVPTASLDENAQPLDVNGRPTR